MTRFFLLLLAVLGLALPCAAAPLEAYGKLPSIEAMEISPDGTMLATVYTNGEERTLFVTRLDDEKVVVAAKAGAAKLRDIRWAGSNHILITISRTAAIPGVIAPRSEYFLVQALDVRTGRPRPLMKDVDYGLNIVTRFPQVRIVDGKPLVFLNGIHFVDSRGRVGLFRIEIEKGTDSQMVEPGYEHTREWVVDARGAPLAQSEFDSQRGRWGLRLKQDGRWREVKVEANPLEPPDLLGVGRDGRAVVVGIQKDEALAIYEVSGEVWSEPLAVGDFDQPLWDPVDYNLIGYFGLVKEDGRYTFFEPKGAKVWQAVTKAYPGQAVRLVSVAQSRRKMIVLVDSPTEGPAYALIDLVTKRGAWVGAQYTGLKPDDIFEVKPVNFTAKDGLELSGYLTLPRGRPAKKLPLVVLAHGGPAARDTAGFDWWSQALASRGYAVLRVNFRGSDGFGWKFLSAGFGEWGRNMQTDLSDGVRHLAAEGLIDPSRVCIVGASYGGYAALAGATLDKGVYRCAASVAGPADLKKMIDYSRDRGGRSSLRYWTRFMGAKDLSDPVLKAISPADQAAKADIPILLVHGRDDTVVPLAQSRIMADALQKAGKPVELVVMKGEDHWLTRGETRLQMLQSVVGFLERNNPPS